MTLNKTHLALLSSLVLAGCGGVEKVYFADNNGNWQQIDRADFEARQKNAAEYGNAPPTLLSYGTPEQVEAMRAAIARNPTAQRRGGQFSPDMSQQELADLALEAALEICNIPPGTRLSDTTPCNPS